MPFEDAFLDSHMEDYLNGGYGHILDDLEAREERLERDDVEEPDEEEEGSDDLPEDDGQPDHYTEMQDYMGGDDWDHGQFDGGE